MRFHGTEQDAEGEVNPHASPASRQKDLALLLKPRWLADFLFYVSGPPPLLLSTGKVLNILGHQLDKRGLSKSKGSESINPELPGWSKGPGARSPRHHLVTGGAGVRQGGRKRPPQLGLLGSKHYAVVKDAGWKDQCRRGGKEKGLRWQVK